MTKGQYPIINNGLGLLTPELWGRVMAMLRAFESKDVDERRAKSSTASASFFLAKLTDAKCVATNKYIYAWEEVIITAIYTFSSEGKTSEGDTDEWDFAAMNLLEGNNTGSNTATGVDESSPNFPDGYTYQAIGGGYATSGNTVGSLGVDPIVIMWKSKGNYVFTAANSYDGDCNEP